mgnify:CR=1 FL=1
MKKSFDSKIKLDSIWKARLDTIYALLSVEKNNQDNNTSFNKFNILITDIDAIWTKYQDLPDFLRKTDKNIDVFHSYATKHPKTVYKVWKFTICGCIAFGNGQLFREG